MLGDRIFLWLSGVIVVAIILALLPRLPRVEHAKPVVEQLPCDFALTSYRLETTGTGASDITVTPVTAPRPDNWDLHKYTITVNGRTFTFIERKCVS